METSVPREPMITLQLRMSAKLMERIDTYRFGLMMRPSRSQAMRFLLENALNILDEHQGETK